MVSFPTKALYMPFLFPIRAICLIIFIPTPYLRIPWIRALLEKLNNFQLVKKFSAFYGTRRFITAFTRTRQLSLSLASSTQSIPPYSTSRKPILILSSHLRLDLPSGLFPYQNLVSASPLLHTFFRCYYICKI